MTKITYQDGSWERQASRFIDTDSVNIDDTADAYKAKAENTDWEGTAGQQMKENANKARDAWAELADFVRETGEKSRKTDIAMNEAEREAEMLTRGA